MEEIESFVRKLCAEGDLSILTKKLIRTQYQAHYKKTTVTREEKEKINEVLETVIQELADQTKDPPASTEGEQFVSPASLAQGKENLRREYVGTEPSTVGSPHKGGYKPPRVDLGGANLSYNHLIQVSLNEKTDKASSGRFRSSSAGNSEVPPSQRRRPRSSPRKRTSSDSVSGNRRSKDSGDNCDSSGVSEGVEGGGHSDQGVDRPSAKIRRRRADSGRNADTYSNCSSDEVLVLSVDSDSSVSSRKSKVNSPPKWRKARMERMNSSGKADVSSVKEDRRAKPATKQRQQNKTRRMVTVQKVLSAILESDDPSPDSDENGSEVLRRAEKDRNSSALERTSGRPRPLKHSPSVKAGAGSRFRDSHRGEKQGKHLIKDHSAGLAHRPGSCQLGRSNKRTKSGYLAESDDSRGTPHGSDGVSSPREKGKRVGGSVSGHVSDSPKLLKSGFSADRFFKQKVKPVPKSKSNTPPKRRLVESDSDVSISSMPSPVCAGKNGRLAPHTLHHNGGAHSDSSLSEKESPGRISAKKPLMHNSRSSHNGCVGSAKRRLLLAEQTHPARERLNPTSMTAQLKAKTEKRTLKSKAQKRKLSSDGSDTDDLPLSRWQHKEAKTDMGEEYVAVTGSEWEGKRSGLQKNEQRDKAQTVRKKMKPCERNGAAGPPFCMSPPLSPVVKKALKQNQRKGRTVLNRGGKDVSPNKASVISKNAGHGSSCEEEEEELSEHNLSSGSHTSGSFGTSKKELYSLSNSSLLAPGRLLVIDEEKGSQPNKKGVYSLSDSSGEKLVPGEMLVIDESKGHRKSNSLDQHDILICSLSESMEDDTGNGQLPVKQKTKINRGKMGSVCKVRAFGECVDASENSSETDTAMTEHGPDSGSQPAEENGVAVHCDQPWSCVAYRGESLMFPVIQLRDVRPEISASSRSCRPQTVSSKPERNIFEVLDFTARLEKDRVEVETVDDDNKQPKVCINISEVSEHQQHQHHQPPIGSDSGDHQLTDQRQFASLDESRTVLKKQRTVKKITPHLRTTLKLRKQVSPDVSSEVEEWAVVSQEETEGSGDGGGRSQDGSNGVETSRPKRQCADKSKARKRKAMAMLVSSDDDDDNRPLMMSVKNAQGSASDSESDWDAEDDTPVKVKKPKKKKVKVQLESSDEDDLPLKAKADPVDVDVEDEDDIEDVQLVIDEDADVDSPLNVRRSKKRNQAMKPESDDDDDDDSDDKPLKPKSASLTMEEEEDEPQNIQAEIQPSEDDLTPLKVKKTKKKKRLAVESSDDDDNDDDDDDDDKPLKPKSSSAKETEECQDDQDGVQESENDSTPPKTKTSRKAPKLIFVSSDDGSSPMKVRLKPSQESESDLDTSSLSSLSGDEARQKPSKSEGPRIKFTMKKVQPSETTKSEKSKSKEKRSKKQKVKAAVAEKDEAPYLKRLRLICRKVGIFVRNDVHFAGCSTDTQKIERLKEALKKAGMKGQPSLSKVDSVNLRREAEALDTANIIETSGRPKRKPKDVFEPASPKRSLSPVKQQFSRIQDLISDSESD